MNRAQKILIGLGVVALVVTMYKVMQRKTLSKPIIKGKEKSNFSNEEVNRYNQYGLSFARPKI
jgi:hypothetical protein